MKRYIFFFLVFFISFFIAFVYTFPIKEIISFYANKFGIKYSKIDGNFFDLKMEDISYKNLYIKKLNLTNRIYFIKVFVNDKKLAHLNLFTKILKLKTNKLKLENFQKKPQIYGNIDIDLNVLLKKNHILLDGGGKSLIKKISFFPFVSNLDINFSSKPEFPNNKIKASISSNQINGTLNAKVKIPLGKNITLDGMFEGKAFGRNIKQKINIEHYKKYN